MDEAKADADGHGLVDSAMEFLARASNETLGACLVGLGAATYLVLGRVGLVVMGVAGGVVLHATWEGSRGLSPKPKESGLQVVTRILDWKAQQAVDEEDSNSPDLTFSAFEPQTGRALDGFTDAVIRDYVKYWYDPLVVDRSFPSSCKNTLVSFLLSLAGHLKRKRAADVFLDFVTNASSLLIVVLNELAAALNASPYVSAEEAITHYLEMKPESSLAYLLDEKSQNRKLDEAAESIIQPNLDSKAYNCPPVRIFLKQILAHLVLEYTVDHCSSADFINEWIVYGLEQSETTKEVMEIVDASVGQPEKAPKKGQMSRAEEAMDEAMREAQRLTQLMLEEDQKRASLEDVSLSTTPASTRASSEKDRPETPMSQFTSFDQIVTQTPKAQLTLHNANISIFDDSAPGERTSLKAKPNTDYLVQIEPANADFSGWMIARKYADFETLHEVLRRISAVAGVPHFTQAHSELPKWRTHTKASLRSELERYLTDAVRFQPLAESEGMKRFLERDRGLPKSSSDGNKGFGWPAPDAFGKFGGDMMNVLTKAPKQVVGGVGGLLARTPWNASPSPTRIDNGQGEAVSQSSAQKNDSNSQRDSVSQSSPQKDSLPPREIVTAKDNELAPRISRESVRTNNAYSSDKEAATPSCTASVVDLPYGMNGVDTSEETTEAHVAKDETKKPLTYSETAVVVELLFAMITELYTLSSAWQIRRTLLVAAKNYLLRPGNPQLTAIMSMLQTDLLDKNLSDEGIAARIAQLRSNVCPTSEEREACSKQYPDKTAEQKEELRIHARKLLVTKGMPLALQSVMGAAASGEAMGKVFDCLQIPAISKGLVFGLLLQALRIVTH
ncbi:hypothetical protein K470DRAFT_219075 [Piedraia hortae CBS 480.64]|uniref:PXA domain-containing protein n=1 Tax=Piedraia hortae CBS 480.64 TaxID=1314780 RepID=A0A6A7BYB5_9PEZI|nr:hypothetical protein K470DRAFT_219075 [Piedraia hortae CBS 480.64]